MEENREPYETPAVAALAEWLEETGITTHRFALDAGLDPAETRRMLKKKGAVRVSAETAVKIERATRGAVTCAMWVPVRRDNGSGSGTKRAE